MGELFRSLAVRILVGLLIAGFGQANAEETPAAAENKTGVVINAGESKASIPTNSEPKANRFSANAALRESSNLISNGSHGHESQTQLSLGVAMKLGNWGRVAIDQGLSKSHQAEETLDLTNTKVGVRHSKIKLHRDVEMRNGLYTRLPTNRNTREKDRLQGALGLENLLDIRLGQGPIVITNRMILNKNFHEYTVNATGSPTVEWSFTEGVNVKAEISKIINVNIDAEFLSSRTYRGTTKSRIELSEEIGVDITKDVSIALGHSNGDDLISSTQKSSNIEAFDQTTSTIYGELSVSF